MGLKERTPAPEKPTSSPPPSPTHHKKDKPKKKKKYGGSTKKETFPKRPQRKRPVPKLRPAVPTATADPSSLPPVPTLPTLQSIRPATGTVTPGAVHHRQTRPTAKTSPQTRHTLATTLGLTSPTIDSLEVVTTPEEGHWVTRANRQREFASGFRPFVHNSRSKKKKNKSKKSNLDSFFGDDQKPPVKFFLTEAKYKNAKKPSKRFRPATRSPLVEDVSSELTAPKPDDPIASGPVPSASPPFSSSPVKHKATTTVNVPNRSVLFQQKKRLSHSTRKVPKQYHQNLRSPLGNAVKTGPPRQQEGGTGQSSLQQQKQQQAQKQLAQQPPRRRRRPLLWRLQQKQQQQQRPRKQQQPPPLMSSLLKAPPRNLKLPQNQQVRKSFSLLGQPQQQEQRRRRQGQQQQQQQLRQQQPRQKQQPRQQQQQGGIALRNIGRFYHSGNKSKLKSDEAQTLLKQTAALLFPYVPMAYLAGA